MREREREREILGRGYGDDFGWFIFYFFFKSDMAEKWVDNVT